MFIYRKKNQYEIFLFHFSCEFCTFRHISENSLDRKCMKCVGILISVLENRMAFFFYYSINSTKRMLLKMSVWTDFLIKVKKWHLKILSAENLDFCLTFRKMEIVIQRILTLVLIHTNLIYFRAKISFKNVLDIKFP